MNTLAEKRQAREVAVVQHAGDAIEQVLIKGDLSALTLSTSPTTPSRKGTTRCTSSSASQSFWSAQYDR